MRRLLLVSLAVLVLQAVPLTQAAWAGTHWEAAWPRTDFSKHAVPIEEIRSGGPGKDGIPSIDDPRFHSVSEIGEDVAPTEPVIGLVIDGDARAYPLQILTWHEIVNDTVGGRPVAVTYCPLCNAAIVFDRQVGDLTLEFGTTGNLRNSDLVMYDRETESWWQQYTGEAIVGELMGATLTVLPARLESFERFAARFPEGKVLVPTDPSMRPYGVNPYRGYDTMPVPFLYDGSTPEGIAPMARVVVVKDVAWSLEMLAEKKRIRDGDMELIWEPGQNSALDSRRIADGRDVGNVIVRKNGVDIAYEVTFAFVFHAFRPDGRIVQ